MGSGMADLRLYFLPSGSSSNFRNVHVEAEEEETESMPLSNKPNDVELGMVDGCMFCTVCMHDGRSNIYSTVGCSNLEYQTLGNIANAMSINLHLKLYMYVYRSPAILLVVV